MPDKAAQKIFSPWALEEFGGIQQENVPAQVAQKKRPGPANFWSNKHPMLYIVFGGCFGVLLICALLGAIYLHVWLILIPPLVLKQGWVMDQNSTKGIIGWKKTLSVYSTSTCRSSWLQHQPRKIACKMENDEASVWVGYQNRVLLVTLHSPYGAPRWLQL